MQNTTAIIVIFADILIVNTYIVYYIYQKISQLAMRKEIIWHTSFRFNFIMRILKMQFIPKIIRIWN